MTTTEYIFTHNNVVHVLQTKPSSNSKIGVGYVVQTYHFSLEQVANNDLKLDVGTCFDCPFSYNQNGGKSGGCYTHKGFQAMGLRSMLKRLNKLNISPLCNDKLDSYLTISKELKPSLTRIGSYGEGTTLPLNIVGKLCRISPKHTGYTHQYNKAQGYSKYLMASTHNVFETSLANSLGFRAFSVGGTGAVCPASKEFKGNKKTCNQCAACDGTNKGKRNNITIKQH